LSGRGLCDELITRPEESYRLCCVVVCDLETSRMGAPYIHDISRLRVNEADGSAAFSCSTSRLLRDWYRTARSIIKLVISTTFYIIPLGTLYHLYNTHNCVVVAVLLVVV